MREQRFLRNVQAIRDALFRAASEFDQLVNDITSGEHAMQSPDGAQAIASVSAYEQGALEKYRRTLDAMMEILQETRAGQLCDPVNAAEPEINASRLTIDPSNHPDERTTTLQAIQDELRQTIESLKSANDAICSADQTIEMLTQALLARYTADPSSPWSEPLSGMPGEANAGAEATQADQAT